MWIQKFSPEQLQQAISYRRSFAAREEQLVASYSAAPPAQRNAILAQITECSEAVKVLDESIRAGGIPFVLAFTSSQRSELSRMHVSLQAKAAILGRQIQKAGIGGNVSEVARLNESLQKTSMLISGIEEALGPLLERPKEIVAMKPIRQSVVKSAPPSELITMFKRYFYSQMGGLKAAPVMR